MHQLLFIYNANSGKMNALLDVGHKLLSPKTYACHLCALTYTTFSEKETWKSFRKQSNIPMIFLHIDEFDQEFRGENFKYPIILMQKDKQLMTFMSKEEINAVDTVESLVQKISLKLEIIP